MENPLLLGGGEGGGLVGGLITWHNWRSIFLMGGGCAWHQTS